MTQSLSAEEIAEGTRRLAKLVEQENADDAGRANPSGALRRAHNAWQSWLLDDSGADKRAALLAMASRLVELEPEHAAMLTLLKWAGDPLASDRLVAITEDEDDDAEAFEPFMALDGFAQTTAKAAASLAAKLGWPGPTSQAKGG